MAQRDAFCYACAAPVAYPGVPCARCGAPPPEPVSAFDPTVEWVAAILDAARDGVAVLEEGRIVFANRPFATILGYDGPSDVIGVPVHATQAPRDRERLAEYGAQRLRGAGAPGIYEYAGLRQDGSEVPLEASVSVVEVDGRRYILTTVRDVALRKRAEEALRVSERQYRSLVETSSELIWSVDVEGRFAFVNQAARRMLGYEPEELVGRRFTDFQPADQAEFDMRTFARTLVGGQVFDYETVLIHKDGSVVQLCANAIPLRDEGGEIVGVTGTSRDVTERRRLESLLRRSQRMESLGRLAGGIAHDFNNLLTVISGYSDIMLRRLPTADPLRAEATEIRRAADRAASLTRQLLAFSRRQVLKPEVLDLNTVVVDMQKMLRRLIGEHIELETELADDLDRIKADPGQLEQVIVNLAVNARDAMPGGGRLLLETLNVTIGARELKLFPFVRPSRYVSLVISDTGHGMDSDTQSHVFEPFFTTKGEAGGTGLGLATVYGIVKQSGGYILIDSDPGAGTSFTILMPATDEEPQRSDKLASGARQGKGTVLLVEDESGVRALAKSALEMYGYRVLDAPAAAAAIEIAQRRASPVDVLVTDVVMPGLGGVQLAERLAAMWPGLPVLFISGYAEEQFDGRDFGPLEAFLPKPFRPDDLAEAVGELLDRVGKGT